MPSDAPVPVSASTARSRWMVIGALILASLVKIAWACTSAGSVDAVLFYNFARAINDVGLCGLYPIEAKFNHTPLTSGFIVLLYQWAQGDFLTFSALLRLAAIVADAAVVVGLLQRRERLGAPPWWALALFAASPVSLMISGFHGNVDPIMVALLFFAAVAAVSDRPVLCGVLFALSCNVKIVPIAFGPVFFFYWVARGKGWRFALPTAVLLLAGSAWPLLVCPREYLRNVFGYGSTWGVWGFTCLLRLTGWDAVQKIDFQGLSQVQIIAGAVLKYTVLGGILFLAWSRRAATSIFATLGGAWLIFFTFAPGIGVQYMAWFAPFVLLLAPRGYAALTAGSSILLAVFYQMTSEGRFPWFLAMPKGPEAPVWSAVGLLPWLTFVILLVGLAPRLWKLSEDSDRLTPVANPSA